MKLPGLPRKVLLIPSQNIHIEVTEAIRLVAIRRAREVFNAAGEFLGIELGHYGPQQKLDPLLGMDSWSTIELPGLRFQQPRGATPFNERTITAYAL